MKITLRENSPWVSHTAAYLLSRHWKLLFWIGFQECPWKIDTAFPLWRRDFKEDDFKKLAFPNLSLSVWYKLIILNIHLDCWAFLLWDLGIQKNQWKRHLFWVFILKGLVGLHRTFSFFSITGQAIDLDYCDIEWFALEMNRDHSVFEIASNQVLCFELFC